MHNGMRGGHYWDHQTDRIVDDDWPEEAVKLGGLLPPEPRPAPPPLPTYDHPEPETEPERTVYGPNDPWAGMTAREFVDRCRRRFMEKGEEP